VFDEWAEQLAGIAMDDPDADPLERARATWRALLAGLPKRRALLLSYVEAMAQAERTPQLRQQFAEHYQGVRARVAALVAQSLCEEITADDPRAAAIATWMIAVCDGLALQWLLDPGSMPSAADLNAGHALMWRASAEMADRSATS
jgi:hypothetical protein